MTKPIEITLMNPTQLIAHRGLSALAPENSLEAFNLAGEYGYYGVECDIHVTKDRDFVVFHDFTLERMTGVKGFIKNLTVEEIKKLNLISGNHVTDYQNVKIPTLSEYLEVCIKYHMRPVIEIKEVLDNEDLDGLLDLLKSYHLLETVYIISFRLDYLTYLREKEKRIPIAILVDEINENTLSVCRNYQFDVDCDVRNISIEMITICHNHHLLVNVYTVDKKDQALELNKGFIDFMTTNCLYTKRK